MELHREETAAGRSENRRGGQRPLKARELCLGSDGLGFRVREGLCLGSLPGDKVTVGSDQDILRSLERSGLGLLELNGEYPKAGCRSLGLGQAYILLKFSPISPQIGEGLAHRDFLPVMDEEFLGIREVVHNQGDGPVRCHAGLRRWRVTASRRMRPDDSERPQYDFPIRDIEAEEMLVSQILNRGVTKGDLP